SHRRIAAALAAMCIAGVATGGSGSAQQATQPTAPQAAQPAPPPPELKQVALTDQQIQGLLNSQNEMDAITSKLPDDHSKPPDPKVIVRLDAVAKQHGFASYADYGNVAANVDMLLDGFDPQTRKF